MKEISFNLNSYIKVQLTELGHKIHEENHNKTMGRMLDQYPYKPVKEDVDGWSRWQAWDFISQFGPHMRMGIKNPASTEIKFEIE